MQFLHRILCDPQCGGPVDCVLAIVAVLMVLDVPLIMDGISLCHSSEKGFLSLDLGTVSDLE